MKTISIIILLVLSSAHLPGRSFEPAKPDHGHDRQPGRSLAIISPDTLDFKTVRLDTVRSLPLIIRNDRSDTLRISSLKTTHADFSIVTHPDTVLPGDTAAIIISFLPQEYRSYVDSLIIVHGDVTRYVVLMGRTAIIRSVVPVPHTIAASESSLVSIHLMRSLKNNSLPNAPLIVTGSIRGSYAGTTMLTDSGRTLSFTPAIPFLPGERIYASLTAGSQTMNNEPVAPFCWQFSVSPRAGSGSFHYTADIEIGDITGEAVMTDLNHDGLSDLAYVSYSYNQLIMAVNNGNGTFVRKTKPLSSMPTALTAGDFNNDGYNDLAVISQRSKSITVLKGNANGSITPTTVIGTATGPESILSADLNGDGKPEFITSSLNSSISIYNNTGGFVFDLVSEINVTNPYVVAAGDLDNDGDLDLITSNRYGNNVIIFENRGGFQFIRRVTIPLNGDPIKIICADFDNDLDADIATLNGNNSSVSVIRNNGAFSFTSPGLYAYVGYPVSFVSADFDDDGDLDISVQPSEYYFSYLSNNGNLNFIRSSVSPGFEYLRTIAAGDVDNDGDIDLAFTSGYNNTLVIARNRDVTPEIQLSPTTIDFQTERVDSTAEATCTVRNTGAARPLLITSIVPSNDAFSVAPASGSVAAGDSMKLTIRFRPSSARLYTDSIAMFSNDPRTPRSVIMVRGSGDLVRSYSPHPYSSNAADSTPIVVQFAAGVNAASLSDSTILVSGIWSGRHHSASLEYHEAAQTLTVRSARPFLPGEEVTVTLTPGITLAGSGTPITPHVWNFKIRTNTSTGIFRKKKELSVPAAPTSSVSGDFDNDGDLDLALLSHDASVLSLLRNDSNWTFSSGGSLSPGFGPSKLLTGDYDNDGLPDLVVSNADAKLTFFKNTGNMKFTPIPLDVQGYIELLTQGDYDGDGDLDLAAASTSSDGSYNIIRNDGGFQFTVFSASLQSYINSLYSGDLDNDGDIDIMLGNNGRVLRNDGNFMFTTILRALNTSVAAGWDMNGDGAMDIIGGFYPSGFLLHKNSGGLRFEQLLVDGYQSINDAKTADDDGDGREDITILVQNELRRYKNTGDWIFKRDSIYGVPNAGYHLLRADLDGDGDMDAAVASISSNVLGLYENRTPYTQISVKPSFHNFGAVEQSRSDTAVITVTNSGTIPLIIDTILSSTGAITVFPSSGVVPPKRSLLVRAVFMPADVRKYSDSITIHSNDPERPTVTVYVAGGVRQVLIDSVYPGAHSSAADASVYTVRFRQDMVPASLVPAAVRINGSVSGFHTCRTSYDPGSKTLTILPEGKMIGGEVVCVSITPDIQLMSGDPVLTSYSWSFTVRVSGGAAVFRSIGKVPVSEYPQFLCAADLDGNGNAEIIVGNTSGSAVSIVSWNGAAFVTAGNIPVGSFQNDVGAGDLDSDGLIDLVVNRTGAVVLLKNSGAFQFTQTSLVVPADAYGQAIGDFDGDGKLDIAVGSRTDHTVRIFRNTGAMGFTLMGSPYAVESPQQLTASDFDNDGSIDILASKTSGNSFTLLRNDGYGIFSPVILPNIGTFVRTMIAADLNNDHRLDIAAEQSGNNSITILRNNGGLQFQSFPQSGVSYDPLSIASADLDGDRDIDIVSVNNGFSLTGSIYLNDSMRFRQKSTFAIESGSHNTIAQDLNGDGTMDIALVNQASSSISVLFNFSSGGNLLSRQSADLGDVKIGDSAAENIVLWRGLPDTVTIDTAYVRGGIFSVQTGKRSVGPFDSAAFRIVFTPPGTGFFTDTLTVKIGKDPEYTVLLSGTGTPVSGVVQNDGTIPAVFSLDQNYPNPFNPSTTIRFGLPEQSWVEITVYNILGQKISDIVNTVLDAGFYHQHWTAPRSSGAYIYQMNAVGINPPYHRFQRTGKMMLVR